MKRILKKKSKICSYVSKSKQDGKKHLEKHVNAFFKNQDGENTECTNKGDNTECTNEKIHAHYQNIDCILDEWAALKCS